MKISLFKLWNAIAPSALAYGAVDEEATIVGPDTPLPVTADTGRDLVPVVPSNDDDLDAPALAIRCKPISGAAGTLRFTADSGEVRNTEIDKGELLPVRAVKIHATGTTATGLEALI